MASSVRIWHQSVGRCNYDHEKTVSTMIGVVYYKLPDDITVHARRHSDIVDLTNAISYPKPCLLSILPAL